MARVYVAGSINMDLVARAARHPRPGETVAGTHVATYPGGKGANQAIAAARLGAETILLGKLGTDTFGNQLRDFLSGQGVQLDYLRQTAAAATGVALIVVAESGENSIVVVPGANALLEPDDLANVPIAAGDVVLSQFEIPLATIQQLFTRARAVGATTILNPAPAQRCAREVLALADVLILNESELAFFADTASIALLVPGRDRCRRAAPARWSKQTHHRDARRASVRSPYSANSSCAFRGIAFGPWTPLPLEILSLGPPRRVWQMATLSNARYATPTPPPPSACSDPAQHPRFPRRLRSKR